MSLFFEEKVLHRLFHPAKNLAVHLSNYSSVADVKVYEVLQFQLLLCFVLTARSLFDDDNGFLFEAGGLFHQALVFVGGPVGPADGRKVEAAVRIALAEGKVGALNAQRVVTA